MAGPDDRGYVAVRGIRELRAALKVLGDVEATREYKQAGYDAMANVVVPKAQANASTRGQVRAMETLRPSKTITGGAVRFGRGFAGAFGHEFGAIQDAPRNTARGIVRGWNQFPAWRGSDSGAGYVLWPTIRENSDQIVEEFNRGLEPLIRRLFPD